MARKKKGRSSEGAEAEDFVPAVFARSPEEAEEYRELLNDHDIPAIIHSDEEEKPPRLGRSASPLGKGISRGVPVLVPEALLDEASEVIADRDYDDFQPGEEVEAEDDEEAEDQPLAAAAETEDDEELPIVPKGKDDPFAEGEEDAFDLEEGDDPLLRAAEALDEDMEVEDDTEEEEEGEEAGEEE